MAITNSTLSAAITADTSRIPVASSTGATVGQLCRIDDEFAVVKEVISSTLVEVKHRGSRGTLAKAHTTGRVISFHALAEDQPTPGPRQRDALASSAPDEVSYAADGAIAVPTRDTIAYVTKGSAAALTLAAPSKASTGIYLHIVSRTAYAHTVTYTEGFQVDTTTSDVATFAAKSGANLLLRAIDGAWVCVNIVASATAQVVIA